MIQAFLETIRIDLYDPDTVAGECDAINGAFLEFIGKGYLLCVGEPTKEPDIGWNYYGKPELITHYLAVVDDTVYDFTARQFDKTAPVPNVYPVGELRNHWKDCELGHDARIDLNQD
jgi:hypothetical protein